MEAHKEYRNRKYRKSIHECGNAFESTLKAICEQRGWKYNADKDTAKKLIGIVLDNELIPKYFQDQFTKLQGLLESSAPALRNKKGGHGQGAKPDPAPDYLAAYQLHQTAAAILFLVEAHQAKP